jgi:hypothetical protein
VPLMPDTRIALSGLSGGEASHSSASPLGTLGSMMQIKEQQQAYEGRRLENEKRRRELEDDDDVSNALTQHARPEDAIDYLWKNGKADAATKLSKDVLGARTAQWQESDAKLKQAQTALGHSAQLLDAVVKNNGLGYSTIRPQVAKIAEPIYGPGINDILPTEYGDGSQVKMLVDAGTTRAEQIAQARDLADNHIKLYAAGAESAVELGKHMPELLGPDGKLKPGIAKWSKAALENQDAQRELLNRTLLTATSEDQYNGFLKTAYDNGMPKEVLDDTPGWIDDPKERHARLTMAGLSMKERGALEAQSRNAATAETRADVADLRAQAAERRAEDAERRRRERDEARGKLTIGERYTQEDKIKAKIDAAEKLAKEEYDKNPPRDTKTKKRLTDESGKPLGFSYDRLPDDAKKEYVQRRVEAENESRERLQGLPTIEAAAKTAAANRDQAGYGKLQEVYKNITQGLGRLDDIVPWPESAGPLLTPQAQEQRKKYLEAIRSSLANPKLTPAARKDLEQQRDRLIAAAK